MGERDYVIQSAGACLDVLLVLGTPEFSAMNEGQISERLNLGLNKVFRALKTLESRSLVKKIDKAWILTPELIRFAEGYRRYIAKKRAELEKIEQEYLGLDG